MKEWFANLVASGRLLSALAIFAAVLPAQRLPIQVYSTTDGLAQSTVHRIFRDSRGFLWFGTSEGVSRYDGYEFQAYREPDRARQRRVRELIETRDGTLWAGTDQGVCRFDPSQARLAPGKRFLDCVKPADRDQVSVQVLFEDRGGDLLAGTDAGLYRVKTAARIPEVSRIELDGHAGGAPGIWAIRRDSSGAVWVGATNGLYHMQAGQSPWRFTTRHGLSADEVQALEFDPEGRLWAGTKEGLCLIRRSPEPDKPVVERVYTMQDGLPAVGVKVLHFGVQDTLWVGTTAGIAEAVRDAKGAVSEFRPYSSRHGLSHLDIDTMQDDMAGNLWIGSQSGGAMKIARGGFVSYGTADGLGSPYVMAMMETRTGQICAMTRVPGKLFLNFLEGDRFRAVAVPLDSSFYSSRWSGWYQVVAEANDGRWWLASERGLLLFPPGGARRGQGPSSILTARDGLTGNHIYQVFEDSQGGIWMVTRYNENGLARWDPQTKNFQRFTTADGLPSLENGRPNGFGEDKHGQLWIGWWRTGVLRYAGGRFQFFGTADGVPPGGIRRVLTDRRGRVWIGSGGGGVARIDNPAAPQPTFQTYGPAQGLSAAEVQALAEDRFGRIYIGTGHGVDRIDPDASGPLRVRRFTALDGLSGGELQTAMRDREGVLWFGSVQGVSRLLPTPDGPKAPLVVYITGVKVNGQVVPIPNGASASVDLSSLKGSHDQLQIEFVSPRFAPGETISYQFRMSAKEEWSGPSTQRAVLYAELPDGLQRFEVRAIGSDGEASPASAILTFDVIAPFWRRWWFFLLCFGALAAAVYALHRFDLRRRLEVEAVRMRIARDLHDQVGSGLSQIAILSEVAQRSSDRAPVSQIAEVSRELVDGIGDIVWAINPARDNLPDLAQRMHRFAADLLSARDVAVDFQARGLERAATMRPEVRRQIYLIFRECLSNVARHSNCNRVTIRVVRESGCLVLTVEDDGVGFTPATAINGNGLASLRQRAASLGGRIDWAGSPGTVVTLRVPLPA